MKSSLKCHMSHSIDCDYEVCQNHHKFLANFSVSLNLSNCLQVNIMNSTDIIVNTTIATTTYDTSVLIEFASPSQTTPMTKNITSTTTILPWISSIDPTLGQRFKFVRKIEKQNFSQFVIYFLGNLNFHHQNCINKL